MRLDRRPTGLLDTLTEGPALRLATRGLATFRTPGAPFRGENDLGEPRPGPMPSPSLDAASSYRLSAFLGRTVKMLRIHFYNRRFASRAPVNEERLLRRLSAARRGKTRRRFDFEDVPGRGVSTFGPWTAPDHLAVIRPPAASCLTARCRLRAVRSPTLVLSHRWRELHSLIGWWWLRRADPLTPLSAPGRERGAPDFPVA